jgi:hypothetical protein
VPIIKTKHKDIESTLIVIFSRCIETKEDDDEHRFVVVFSGQCTKTKKRRGRPFGACHHLLWVHRNKIKKDNDKHQHVIVFFGCTKKKKQDDDNVGACHCLL